MINVGDLVTLRGRVYPVMTVTEIRDDVALCRWQVEGLQTSSGFLLSELIKAKKHSRTG